MAMSKSILLLFMVASTCLCEAYKILVVFPVPGKSHSILGAGVVRHLLNAGHEVTYITSFLLDENNPNLHQVDVTDNLKIFPESLSLKSIMKNNMQINDHKFVIRVTSLTNIKTLENPKVQMLLNDTNQKFDAVIVEWMFSTLLSGLSAVYNAPLIWVSSLEPHWVLLSIIDEIPNPAYNSDILSLNTPPLNFIERVEELWTVIKALYIRYKYENEHEFTMYEKLIVPQILKRRNKVRSMEEVKYSGSLVLGNSHVSVGHAIRLPQNYKHVGGYHIEEKVKPLPENIKKIMDEAKDGVIYFSLGSNLRSKDMPEEMKKSLLNMFGSLKQTVLWKFEEELKDKPKNVHILEWAPQPGILAHPNCILFITHGGLLSTTETIHFGVPTIGIPVFADQFVNVIRSVRRGFAIRVDLAIDMADGLKKAIVEVIENPKYSQTVKKLSALYHDRPMTPGKELVYWVEHVIRTDGAPHLKSPALLMPWYQKAYLDLVAILLFLTIILIMLLKKLLLLLKKFTKKDDTKKMN